MHSFDLILTLTGGLAAALVFGYLTQRLRLSPIVGYLVAGLLVGPYTPGYVADRALAEQLAEIGVILLMFGVGLQFHIEELLAVRKVAIPGAVVQSAVATTLGVMVAVRAGWDLSAGIVFGIALSVASTVVLIRVLSDNRQLHTPTGHIAVGWLVVEDLFTVLVLVLMPAVLRSKCRPIANGTAIGLAVLKVAALVVFTIVVGGRTIPWLLAKIARTQSRELFTLAVLVTALGIAVASAEVFGVSMALGAFLAGLVVGRSEFSVRAASDALPMRDAFAVLFFVSVGMLFNPESLVEQPLMIAATLGDNPDRQAAGGAGDRRPVRVPPEGRAVRCRGAGAGRRVLVHRGQPGQPAGRALAGGHQHRDRRRDRVDHAQPPAVSRHCPGGALARRGVSAAAPQASSETPEDRTPPSHRAVVVGYGPVGRTVSRLLRDNEITSTVIELNVDTVRALRADGVHAIYGDATHPATLTAAGVDRANNFIVSIAGLPGVEETFKVARELNPSVRNPRARQLPAGSAGTPVGRRRRGRLR